MKRIWNHLATLFLAVVAFALPGEPLHAQSIPDDVRESIRARVDNGYNVSLVLGVVNPSGTHFFSYGKHSTAGKQTPDEHTVFEIGSVSKVFTALLLADMVERGEVRLDDPIEKYHAVTDMNDQHAFLALPPGSELRVGDMVACGISHPCTTFDRWQVLMVVNDDYDVVSAICTFF